MNFPLFTLNKEWFNIKTYAQLELILKTAWVLQIKFLITIHLVLPISRCYKKKRVKPRAMHYCLHGNIMITNSVVDRELENPLCDWVLQCYIIVIITFVSVPRYLLSPEATKQGTVICSATITLSLNILNQIFHLLIST